MSAHIAIASGHELDAIGSEYQMKREIAESDDFFRSRIQAEMVLRIGTAVLTCDANGNPVDALVPRWKVLEIFGAAPGAPT